ncbi:hypothetical protein BLNAU_20570 [Blattamonas nauphoetae]|uniref:non-specific serine/threonine protein kinase n=1 Tax=Blattamonas nauphoetae TaxID=2049346 RepID=A0ABQ9WYC4_9EUKA|nr:hypothetical protein BLNAU_20570 [Blattamonas nauphoetae]
MTSNLDDITPPGYQTLTKISEGAFGQVLKVSHERNGVEYAAKVLPILKEGDKERSLGDLGGSAPLSQQTSTVAELGTIEYNSPERLMDSKGMATPASDVWSLGVVAYRMVTGKPLFEGLNLVQMSVALHTFDDTKVPLSINPSVRDVLLKMLEPNVALRTTTTALLEGGLLEGMLGPKTLLSKMKSIQLATRVTEIKQSSCDAKVKERTMELELEKQKLLEETKELERQLRSLHMSLQRIFERNCELEKEEELQQRRNLLATHTSRISINPEDNILSKKVQILALRCHQSVYQNDETDGFKVSKHTITRTGVDKDQAWSTTLFEEPISEGVVSVAITILAMPRINYPKEELMFGLVDALSQRFGNYTKLGDSITRSIAFAPRKGRLHVALPSTKPKKKKYPITPPLNKGDSVVLEVDMDARPRTAVFIINGNMPLTFVSGLPPSIRIGFSMKNKGVSIRFDGMSRLKQATSLRRVNEIKWNPEDMRDREDLYMNGMRSSVLTVQTQMPSLVFTDPSHFRVEDNIIASTGLATKEKDGRVKSTWSSFFLAELITEGIVALSFTVFSHHDLSLSFFGLIDANEALPEIGQKIGKLKNSVTLSRNGERHFLAPQGDDKSDPSFYFESGESLLVEINMDSTPRTAQFFVDKKPATAILVGLPESVRVGFSVNDLETQVRFDRITHLNIGSPIIDQLKMVEWPRTRPLQNADTVEGKTHSKSDIGKADDGANVEKKKRQFPTIKLPELIFTNKTHLAIRNNVLTRTEKGTDEKGRTRPSTVQLSDPILKGVVSVTFVVLTLAESLEEKGFIHFGLLESSAVVPQLGHVLGEDVKHSVGLSTSGRIRVFNRIKLEEDCCYSLSKKDRVVMEVNMDSTPRTVQFFVNGQAGKCYLSEIPESVRIGFSADVMGTSLQITSIVHSKQATPLTGKMKEIKWTDTEESLKERDENRSQLIGREVGSMPALICRDQEHFKIEGNVITRSTFDSDGLVSPFSTVMLDEAVQKTIHSLAITVLALPQTESSCGVVMLGCQDPNEPVLESPEALGLSANYSFALCSIDGMVYHSKWGKHPSKPYHSPLQVGDQVVLEINTKSSELVTHLFARSRPGRIRYSFYVNGEVRPDGITYSATQLNLGFSLAGPGTSIRIDAVTELDRISQQSLPMQRIPKDASKTRTNLSPPPPPPPRNDSIHHSPTTAHSSTSKESPKPPPPRTAEINPNERFLELLASFTNPRERNHQDYQRSLVSLLRRYLNHLSNDKRRDLLYRFGAALSQQESQDINIEVLLEIVSSDEDIATLFHFSGLSHSILRQIPRDPSTKRHLTNIAHISEIYPLLSTGTLSEDLSSFFQSFFHDPISYLGNNITSQQSSLRALLGILSNELMACAIIGCGEAVSEIVVTNYPSLATLNSNPSLETHSTTNTYNLFQRIMEISQNFPDPVERIVAFITHLSFNHLFETKNDNCPVHLLPQCLQHAATYLSAHPDLIDTFLQTLDPSPSLSDTLVRRDRHLNLISTLSQSSSPLFAKLTEPLLNPKFPLHTLLSPRMFTDPASSFIRMASTNYVFFRRLIETHTESILDIAVSTAVSTVRVVSDEPSEPRCLDFGRATPNWIVLLQAMAEVETDLNPHSCGFNSIPSSLLTLLVLFAASPNDDLSTAAVSVFSNKFGLSTPHTKALLFATPPTFPVNDAFTPQESRMLGDSDHKKGPRLSICAEAGCCVVMKSRSGTSAQNPFFDFASKLGVHFTGCLVNALHSTTALPHSFHFFSPELFRLSQQPNVWNNPNRPSALTALTTLADITLTVTFPHDPWEMNLSEADEERRDTIFVHLFPFLEPESQTRCLSKFNKVYKSQKPDIRRSLGRVVECLVEMATVNSYNTPIALLSELKRVAEFLRFVAPEINLFQYYPSPFSTFEQSILEKLKTAEGDERWKWMTLLAVVSKGDPDLAKELMKAENDAQALLILSVPTISSTTRPHFHLDKNPAAFNRIVELAGRLDNLPLVAAALQLVGDTMERLIVTSVENVVLSIDRQQRLCELVLDTLRAMSALRREGVEEGCAVGKDEMTSQIVVSCLTIIQVLMRFESFDATPFIDSLVSLAVTSDLTPLRFILRVLQEIEDRTQNTPTPFSIATATDPFKNSHQSSATQQPLPTILSFILLSANLDSSQVLKVLNESLASDIALEAVETVCLILEEDRASSEGAMTPDDSLSTSLDQKKRHTTPQQLFIALDSIVFPDDPTSLSASTFLPLAPFFTRILKIVVPLSTDGTVIGSMKREHLQLVEMFISLFLSLIRTGAHSTLSTPPLSSLLSVLSLALIRLDTIPSSLRLHDRFWKMFELRENRSNPQMRQIVLVLCEEGMEDRSEVAANTVSMTFLSKWKGSNTPRRVGPQLHLGPVASRSPRLPFDHVPPFFGAGFRRNVQLRQPQPQLW